MRILGSTIDYLAKSAQLQSSLDKARINEDFVLCYIIESALNHIQELPMFAASASNGLTVAKCVRKH
jgi:hypothetical protein